MHSVSQGVLQECTLRSDICEEEACFAVSAPLHPLQYLRQHWAPMTAIRFSSIRSMFCKDMHSKCSGRNQAGAHATC